MVERPSGTIDRPHPRPPCPLWVIRVVSHMWRARPLYPQEEHRTGHELRSALGHFVVRLRVHVLAFVWFFLVMDIRAAVRSTRYNDPLSVGALYKAIGL